MTRSTPPLQQHLLTRSDLARMAVPAGEVLSWLGSVALEQVGSLSTGGATDPVFTVLTPELQADLAARLAAIGKTDVVLAPERVRSFLTRVLHAAAPGIAASAGSDDVGLKQLLQEATAAIATGADLDAMQQVAREEAGTEAAGLATAAGDVESGADENTDDLAELAALDTCFDLADLEAVVGGSVEQVAVEAAPEAPAELTPEPESHAPGDEPALTDEPAPIEVEHVSDDAIATPADAAEPSLAEPPPIATPDEPGEDDDGISTPAADSGTAEPEPMHELAADACATDAAAAAAVAGDDASMERVEAFLVLLKDAVIELAQRPAPQQIDMRPFVLAMQAGLDRSTQQAEVTATALETLQARVDGLGERVADAAARPVQAPASVAAPRSVAATAAIPEADPVTTLMAGVAVLALAWSVLFWTALDAPRLAAGTLVGANVVGCLLLSTWWRR